MSQHIEWAHAPRAQFADSSWVEQNADDGNDGGDVALVFDTGSSTVAFYGTPDELRRTVTSMTARLDTFAPVETGRTADETLNKLAEPTVPGGGADEDLVPTFEAIADAAVVRQHGEQFAGGGHDTPWIRFVRLAAIEAAKAGHALNAKLTVADLDGSDDSPDWITPGHVLDDYEVAFIRSLVLRGSVARRG